MWASVFTALLLFSFSALASEKHPEPPRYGVNSDYAMPLIELKRSPGKTTLEGGILKDIGEAIFSELQIKPEVFLVPKKRVAPALLSGSVVMVCHLNEAWQSKIKDDVFWSQGIYRSTNVIVYVGERNISKIKDLYGERVGTVLNFVYQKMDEYFKKGMVVREDGPNNPANVQKLLSGRINFAIMSNIEFEYFKKIYPSLEAADLGLDSVMTKCALSKSQDYVTIERLDKAIATLKKNGQLEKILKQYQFEKK